MDRQSFQAYQRKILSLLKLLGEKDCLNISEIDTNDHNSIDITKDNIIIPFKRIK